MTISFGAPDASEASGGMAVSSQLRVPITLPDKLDWVQNALTRSPEHRLKLTGSRLGKPSFNQAARSVPVIGGRALFLPAGASLGTPDTMHEMTRSRTEQRLVRAEAVSTRSNTAHMLPGAPPSSIAVGPQSRPTAGHEKKWSVWGFDRHSSMLT